MYNASIQLISILRKAKQKSTQKTLNVYCIHAIGGTVYPYYSLLQIFPPSATVFGIQFDPQLNDTFETLSELAHFYASQVCVINFFTKFRKLSDSLLIHNQKYIWNQLNLDKCALKFDSIPFGWPFAGWNLESRDRNPSEQLE